MINSNYEYESFDYAILHMKDNINMIYDKLTN